MNTKVHLYEVYDMSTFIYIQTETMDSLFSSRISEDKIKSAFTHYKGPCTTRGEVCSKTTLIISPTKHYEVEWTRKVCDVKLKSNLVLNDFLMEYFNLLG